MWVLQSTQGWSKKTSWKSPALGVQERTVEVSEAVPTGSVIRLGIAPVVTGVQHGLGSVTTADPSGILLRDLTGAGRLVGAAHA